MIGFSASFAKTIAFCLDHIYNKQFKYVFSSILVNISEGLNEAYINCKSSDKDNILAILEYNGFKVEDLCPDDKYSTQILIKW